MNLNHSKILVLGGTGLIGEELVRRLAFKNSITVVSLGSVADKESFDSLSKQFPKLRHITGNIFLPTKFKDKTFNELVESDSFLEQYLNLLYIRPDFKQFFLYQILQEVQPDLVIDAINSATVLSYTKSSSLIKDYLNGRVVKLETLLATLSIPRLINFFDCLYKSLKATPSVVTYLKIGTTGTGGMGFNIPYTHGEEKPSPQLLEKAAISGAFTSLLYLLSETFGIPKIKEIKPAALVGYKKVGYDRILLGRNSSQSLKVYEYKNLHKIDLKKLRKLDFDDFKIRPSEKDFKAVFVDTGENGQFSEEEFRAISNPKQMGLITNKEIADIVVKELEGNKTGKDTIRAFKESTLGPSQRAQEVRSEVLEEMDSLKTKNKTTSLAFEILGPPRLAKLIFEAYLLKRRGKDWQSLDEEDISLITSTGIPILMENSELLVGKRPKIPSYRSEITEESINLWCDQGWVDLRKVNWEKWKKRLKEYGSSRDSFEIGEIVTWIFEKEDNGFRKLD